MGGVCFGGGGGGGKGAGRQQQLQQTTFQNIYIYIFFFSKKISLNISCKSSVKQMINVKSKDFL